MKRRDFCTAGTMAALGLAVGHSTEAAPLQGGEQAILKPPRLKSGDLLALINPAGATALRMDIEIVEESLQALGFRVRRAAHLLDRYGYLAGTDQDRAADVNEQFADPEVAGLIAVRGGWGCARILPLVDYDVIRTRPKVLLGYSDVTALLLAVHARTGLLTFHGPVGLGPWNRFTVDHFKQVVIEGKQVTLQNPRYVGNNLTQVSDRVQTITPGKAKGRLLGGNLTVLTAMIGSDYLPSFDGAILFLEDVGEEIYRIDRMLTQLQLSGILDRVAGVIFGKCTDCGPGQGYGSLTMEQLFDDHIRPLGVPAWSGAMIGHIPQKFTLPQGAMAEIDATRGTIQLLESPVT